MASWIEITGDTQALEVRGGLFLRVNNDGAQSVTYAPGVTVSDITKGTRDDGEFVSSTNRVLEHGDGYRYRTEPGDDDLWFYLVYEEFFTKKGESKEQWHERSRLSIGREHAPAVANLILQAGADLEVF